MRRYAKLLTGISPRCSLTAAAVVLTICSISAQSTLVIDQLLDRMGAYLIEYEGQLSSLVADERFEQTIAPRGRLSGERLLLESEVAFLRLPGDAEWLGFRDVKKLNSKPIRDPGPPISELLASPADAFAKAVRVARASARHNLGLPRTINTPTTPLHIIHPRYRRAHHFELAGEANLRGQRAAIISFREGARPTLVREPTGGNLVSSGRIWVDAQTGTVLRVQWNYQAERNLVGAQAIGRPFVRVEFGRHEGLQMMVPLEMREVFFTRTGHGDGRATYRNFRRFGTSARIVPQD